MKMLTKQDTIILYSVDLYYFQKHNDVERSYNTQSNWRRATNNTYDLIYGISFKAWDKNSGEHFMKYERRLIMNCMIDDISVDNKSILRIKEDLHLSSKEFIKQNSASYFDRLRFPEIEFLQDRVEREKEAFLEMTKNQEPFELKSETQKSAEYGWERAIFTLDNL